MSCIPESCQYVLDLEKEMIALEKENAVHVETLENIIITMAKCLTTSSLPALGNKTIDEYLEKNITDDDKRDVIGVLIRMWG